MKKYDYAGETYLIPNEDKRECEGSVCTNQEKIMNCSDIIECKDGCIFRKSDVLAKSALTAYLKQKDELKVGDKVMVREDLVVNKMYRRIIFTSKMAQHGGDLLTISGNTNAENYTVEENAFIWSREMLIKQKESNMEFTKKDLRSGMWVETANRGTLMVMLNTAQGDIVSNSTSFERLKYYDDGLKMSHIGDWDIIKVYRTVPGCYCSGENKELIWQRPEEVKKIGVKEACEALKDKYGCKVEISL